MKLVTLAVLLCALPAAAKAPVKRAEAKKHYDAGVAHYKAGEYAEAVTELEAGYALAPESAQLFNLGSACRLAKLPEKAVEYYRKYLEEVPDAANRAVVETRITEMQREIDAKNAPPPPPAPEPAVVAPARTEKPAAAATPAATDGGPRTPYELGARLRYLFVTAQMMAPFLTSATGMNSVSAGVEFVYHKEKYDVVTSLDFSWLAMEDGNYLAVNHPIDTDTQYVQFPNLSFLSADVSIIGHTDIGKWIQIRYGGGLGIGVVLGDVLLTHDNGCAIGTIHDFNQCHPLGVDPSKPIEPQLKATEADPLNQGDHAGSPHRHVSSDKPPVMGVVNLLVGLRVHVHKRVDASVEIGFRDSMFVGFGAHYKF